MDKRVLKGIKKIIRQKKKVLEERENLTNIFTLECEVCGSSKTRYDGKDFELWDRELWESNHQHGLLRIWWSKLRKVKKDRVRFS